MGFLDRLLGREEPGPRRAPGRTAPGSDEAAIERYRYLLRTAPPDALEQAHAEAFAQLTPEQRRQVLAEVSAQVPEAERATSDDPRSLARMATRAELRQPGTLERTFGAARGPGGPGGPGGVGGGVGVGGIIAGSLLASVAGAFVGTAIADSLFDLSDGGDGGGDAAAAGGDAGGGAGGDVSADSGGGFGDFGGGDFGGGDFGGGDF
jgi:hypothetical protein